MNLPVIPAPAVSATHTGTLTVGPGFGVAAHSPELTDLAARFVEDVRLDTGLALSPGSGGITVHLDADGLDDVVPAAGLRADGQAVDERYGLEITGEGARVWATTAEGVHRGLTSLRQLISAGADDGTAVLPFARIVDGPRFGWRGLSLDVVRTFHAPDVVRRVVDMCSLYKLNVLHLHLTDDQGWRFEVPSRPALTEVGATGAIGDRPGGFYSLAELAELVAYAAERFVTVVPEIDMPGHTSAVFRAYPELAPDEIRTVELGNGASLQLSTLNPDRAETWSFVEDVLDAVIPQFPKSAYLHLGGDEAWGMSDEAHAAFVDRAAALVRERGRRVVGWQETARADIGSDDVVQYWMDVTEPPDDDTTNSVLPPDLLPILLDGMRKAKLDLPRALERGARVLVSPTRRLYFDCPHADTSSDPAQEELRKRVGLPIYPPASIEDGVAWDPVESLPGVESETQLAGVEAAIWCETITTPDELEFMLLPRLPGAAEKAWSRQPTDWPDYAARLGRQSPAWAHRNWTWLRATTVTWS
ncbi:beta-N-acetylhexosaminidase [Kribbella sp. CA-247076]|uniref:beta-N-acetylhexosaminidase n=1 Tax=Kribbella sp. CA-247076 TaxID=3239941 RepID=UPI003D92A95C